MDVSNWVCSGCSLGELTGKFPCAVDYTWKTTKLEGKKDNVHSFHSLGHILSHCSSMHLFTIRGVEKMMSLWGNSFMVIALKFSYPLIKSSIKQLQQKTVPLRELMLSSNTQFYSNLVLTDGCTSYNCKDFARRSCVNEVQLQMVQWLNLQLISVKVPRRWISVSSLVFLFELTCNFIHAFYDLQRGKPR